MTPLPWQTAPDTIHLQPQQIHIWRANLDTPPAALALYQSLLSVDETARAERFKFDVHRHRFTVARGILRQILSRYIAVTPQSLCFQYNAHGKPALMATDIAFNLSHANQWAVYAISLHQPIGIDIEQHKHSVDSLAIAERFFSPYENQQIHALPSQKQSDYFFQLWTCKEAFIKAVGTGLSFPLTDFDVTLTENSARLISIQHNTQAAQSWHLYPLKIATDYSSALAVQGEIDKIIMWDMPV